MNFANIAEMSGELCSGCGQIFARRRLHSQDRDPSEWAPDTGPGVTPMKSVSSDQIYLWSKRLGFILLLAMAIVAVGNAQRSSGGEKGKANVAEGL